MKEGSWSEENSRRTIFHDLLTSKPDVGYVVPPIEKLEDEAVSIMAAASDTTGNGMTIAAYNVVQNPVIYEKLKAELQAAFPNPNSRLGFTVLERLPYLVSL
jgi:cytochrome P450